MNLTLEDGDQRQRIRRIIDRRNNRAARRRIRERRWRQLEPYRETLSTAAFLGAILLIAWWLV